MEKPTDSETWRSSFPYACLLELYCIIGYTGIWRPKLTQNTADDPPFDLWGNRFDACA